MLYFLIAYIIICVPATAQKTESNIKHVKITKVSTGKIIHRFFDTSPLSPSGRYLALFRFPYEDHSPKAGDAGDVVLVDIKTGKERVVAQSRAWDYSGRYVIFNGYIGNTRSVFVADLKAVLKNEN